ncbi:site-specific DNA-methyltransferase [uncultured Cloacibacillus sp.]|uniref:DNA-methyltransferase n=1 Tax=uncultured Cloacibacillus sp. TaxID=889794 RepID=UPI0026DA8192|nr:site-specific DNA-methyltransferase [uncultured Cloacibacillus sp.]
MVIIKAARNKTIDIPLSEGSEYLDRCITVTTKEQANLDMIKDKTIIGDMLDVCSMLPAKSIDLIIADPPYNLTKSFNGTTFTKKRKCDYEVYTRQWLNVVKPLLKDDGSIYVCCDWETSLIVGRVLDELFYVRNRITWQREKGRGAKTNWKNGMEDIWFATNSENYVFNLDAVKIRKKVIAPYRINGKPKDWTESQNGNYRDTCPSNFWDDITIPFWSMSENTAHPTQKSEKLMAKIILASSDKGDIVLDPFLGSGTTSVVANKLGRHYIGVEIEAQYCVWAEQRLEMAKNNKEIQGYVNGVFWERNSLPAQHVTCKKKMPIKHKDKTQIMIDSIDGRDIQETLFDIEV